MERNRGSSLRTAAGMAVLIVGAYLFGDGLAEFGRWSADVPDRTREAQKYNHQVEDQLVGRYAVRDLILDYDGNPAGTFHFGTTSPDGQNETCNGHYKVDQAAAAVVDLSCTVVQPVPVHS